MNLDFSGRCAWMRQWPMSERWHVYRWRQRLHLLLSWTSWRKTLWRCVFIVLITVKMDLTHHFTIGGLWTKLFDFLYIPLFFLYTDLTSCHSLIGFITYASNDQITASSQININHGTQQSRLYTLDVYGWSGGWSSDVTNVGEYIQADFRSVRRVEQVATQGRNLYNQWVTSYRWA